MLRYQTENWAPLPRVFHNTNEFGPTEELPENFSKTDHMVTGPYATKTDIDAVTNQPES